MLPVRPISRPSATSLSLISALSLTCAGSPKVSAPAQPAPPHAAEAARSTPAPSAAEPARLAAAPPSEGERANGVSDTPAAEEEPALERALAFREPLETRELTRNSSAYLVSNLSTGACAAELRRRNLAVARDTGAAVGVALPVRITGAMQGVRFVTPSRKSVYGKLDCRLALSLDDLAKVLARHGVVSVRVDNLYRPNARLAGTRTRSQHRYGLAVDIASFVLESGVELSVENDWHAPLGSPPCGPESTLNDPTERAIALRDIVCDVAKSGLFHHILTPSFNEAHRNHLHLDIKRGDRRSVVE